MATLGDLVVNLSANTSRFNTGMKSAESRVTRFTRSATRMFMDLRTIIAGAGVATLAGSMIKLAAESETLAKQFEVLTGSAERARRVMADIDKFAASTPFQKLDIAEAGRKLLAFGSTASEVVGELRMLGDISAATGTPLGDIAEIFGKARVQGRLFAEDINQLTGRGIPVIGALAKQFGVAESEVKKLVEQGKIGFPELVRALQSMTTEGGMFAGMMEELSTTTGGKFSTFKDNIAALGVTIGTELLPAANELLDWATDLIKNADVAAWADFTARSVKDLAEEMSILVELAQSFVETGFPSLKPREDFFGAQQAWKELRKNQAIQNVQARKQNQPAPLTDADRLARQQRADALLGGQQRQIEDAIRLANQIGSIVSGSLMGAGLSMQPDTNLGRFDMNALQRPPEVPLRFAGAAEAGSSAAFDMILSAMRGGTKSAEAQGIDKLNMTVKKEVGEPLKKLADADAGFIIVEAIE